MTDEELKDPVAVLQQAAKEAGNWPAWRKLEQARIAQAEVFFAEKYDEPLKNAVANADKAAFAAMAESIAADANAARLRSEVDRLRAENRKLVEAIQLSLMNLDDISGPFHGDTYANLTEAAVRLRAAIEGK